ncbi:MAG: SPOR domain-containing protein [Chlorobiaceae bacterium]|nr:SPOR domain-containing protein [Chlorobiaceae bacterium]
MQKKRRIQIIMVCIISCLCFPYQQPSATAAMTSYAPRILQYVKEDKVYLLEKIRRQITKPSEKTIVEALLTEDAPEAAKLYRKQLADYPDPSLDSLSHARLAAYEQAISTTPGLPVITAKLSANPMPPGVMAPPAFAPQPTRTIAKPDSSTIRTPQLPVVTPSAAKRDSILPAPPKPKQPAVPAALPAVAGSYTLQFGSFDSITNAEQLSAQISQTTPASVQKINGIYKVRLKRTFVTRQEATSFGRSLPVESFVVSLQP